MPLADPAMELVVEGLDTVADVRVNGQLVLEAANSFREWRADISDAAVTGRNTLEVRIRSSVAEGARLQAARPEAGRDFNSG